MSDVRVYADPDGRHYVASFGAVWVRWPAETGGWADRMAWSASAVDHCTELPPRNAWLALRLTGAPLEGS